MPEVRQFTIMQPSTPIARDDLKSSKFPVVKTIDFDMIAGHEQQARYNHSQSLSRLNERGGLSACEALAVLENRSYQRMSASAANAKLLEAVQAYERKAEGYQQVPETFGYGAWKAMVEVIADLTGKSDFGFLVVRKISLDERVICWPSDPSAHIVEVWNSLPSKIG